MSYHLLLLITVFAIPAALSKMFVSIDCGASDSYSDDNFIVWTGDDDYIKNGESKVVQMPGLVPYVMSTLRVFSTRKKNCYSINAGKRDKVLVRTSFYYGNYDNKSSPPTFDLQLNGNHWQTVVTSIDQIASYEAIYVVKGNDISVCVAQTQPNQLPFISSLEVRSLDASMYSYFDSSTALFLRKRVAFGITEVVRSADDIYDRIWIPASVADAVANVTSEATLIAIESSDKPPTSVLKSAMISTSLSSSIIIDTGLPIVDAPFYINMYFSELSQLNSTEKRSFEVYINNISISLPVIPPYESDFEMLISNRNASSITSFALKATPDSTLPPLLNAMEVFSVSNVLIDGTDSKDVEALALLKDKFDILQDWHGDPCLPAPFSWDWLVCSSDEMPRIIALNLSGFGLSGSLPDFSAMNALQTIDLHNNSLTGDIPDFLSTLQNLTYLNLADNQFNGAIPTSLFKNSMLKTLLLSGDQNLCASGKFCLESVENTKRKASKRRRAKKHKKLILGTVIPSCIIFVIFVITGGAVDLSGFC